MPWREKRYAIGNAPSPFVRLLNDVNICVFVYQLNAKCADADIFNLKLTALCARDNMRIYRKY